MLLCLISKGDFHWVKSTQWSTLVSLRFLSNKREGRKCPIESVESNMFA